MLLLDGGKIAVGHGRGGPKSNSVSVCHLYFLVATRGNSIVGQGAKGIDGAVALKCFHTFPCVQVPDLTNYSLSSSALFVYLFTLIELSPDPEANFPSLIRHRDRM